MTDHPMLLIENLRPFGRRFALAFSGPCPRKRHSTIDTRRRDIFAFISFRVEVVVKYRCSRVGDAFGDRWWIAGFGKTFGEELEKTSAFASLIAVCVDFFRFEECSIERLWFL